MLQQRGIISIRSLMEMSMDKINKNNLIIGSIVLLVVILGGAYYFHGKDSWLSGGFGNMGPSLDNNMGPGNPIPSATPTPTASPTTAGKLSYSDAIKKYGNYRIQFDQACQAHPNNITFKSGTKVMFDNRATVARTINFNGTKYRIASYDYEVINMVSPNGYPATVMVDCDKSQNVASVLLQK